MLQIRRINSSGGSVPASSITGLTPFLVCDGKLDGSLTQSPLLSFQPDSLFVLEAMVSPYNPDPGAPGLILWEFAASPAPSGIDAPRLFAYAAPGKPSDGINPADDAGFSAFAVFKGGDGNGAFKGGNAGGFVLAVDGGGDGTAAAPSGDGATLTLTAGGPGVDNGGGLGNASYINLEAQGDDSLMELQADVLQLGLPGEEIFTRGAHFFNQEALYATYQQHTLIATPAAPPVGQVRSYYRAFGGVATPFFVDGAAADSRVETNQISAGATLAVNQTTASLVFVALPGMALVVNTQGGFLKCWASFSFTSVAANIIVFFRLLVNGVVVANCSARTPATAATPSSASMNARVAVVAGAQNVVIQWRVSASVGQIRPITVPDQEAASLLVERSAA